jgi:hypothetical protein
MPNQSAVSLLFWNLATISLEIPPPAAFSNELAIVDRSIERPYNRP